VAESDRSSQPPGNTGTSAFGPSLDEIRAAGHDVVDRIVQHFEQLASLAPIRGLDDETSDRLRAMTPSPEGRPLEDVIGTLLDDVFSNIALTNHPRFFAFIPSPVSPLSWLGDMANQGFNPFATSWLEGSATTRLELDVIDWLAELVGYPDSAGGVFLSGGSMANLTAMVAARDQKLVPQRRPAARAYVSGQTHSSIAKGLRIIGFTDDQLRVVPTDDEYRLDVDALTEAVVQDRIAGLSPFLVVASGGTTNTGAIDPLEPIVHVCRDHGLWMHVDGAYGAAAVMSPNRRHLLAGLERADSFSFDPHKWGFQTYGCACVLVRDRDHLISSFGTQPEYLRDARSAPANPNLWDFGPELSRPARAVKFWTTIQVLGTKRIAAAIDHGFELAETVEAMLRELHDVKIVSPAQMAIVCFRFEPDGIDADACDALNDAVSRAMIEAGYAAVLSTKLDGRTALRIITLHPETTENDLRFTVDRLAAAAAAVRRGATIGDRSGSESLHDED
jgi:glutamate/tyrosine decarboxylase-like PLP-dependent enzyme